MARHRQITCKGIEQTPLELKAFKSLIRKYYKGTRDIEIVFTNRLNCWGEHQYVASRQTHIIKISPRWCRYNKNDDRRDFRKCEVRGSLGRMNDFDTVSRCLHVALHEMKHAMQCDSNPYRYAKCNDDSHPNMKNASLKYELSPLETEAEGWALLNINKALEFYESKCEYGIAGKN